MSSAGETFQLDTIVRFGIQRYTRSRIMNDGLTDDPPVEDERAPRRIFRRLDTRGREIDWRRNLWAIWLAEMLAILGFSLRTPFLPFYLQDLGADSGRGGEHHRTGQPSRYVQTGPRRTGGRARGRRICRGQPSEHGPSGQGRHSHTGRNPAARRGPRGRGSTRAGMAQRHRSPTLRHHESRPPRNRKQNHPGPGGNEMTSAKHFRDLCTD